jgi:hypothetical protein
MRHDRKLRNAVTKSVIEMLDRSGLTLTWKMTADGEHRLSEPQLATRSATHLGGVKLLEKEEYKQRDRKNRDSYEIRENLHGPGFVGMVASSSPGKLSGPSAALRLSNSRGLTGRN